MRAASASILALVLAASGVFADQTVGEAIAKANAQLAKGKPEEAVKTLEQLVDKNPTSAEAQLALGRLQERTGELERATASYARAAGLAADATPDVRASVLAARASFLLRTGSGAEALKLAEDAVAAKASAEALAVLARAEVRTDRLRAASATAERAVREEPGSPVAKVARGVARLALGGADEAEEDFRAALQADPDLLAARIGLAEALLARGQSPQAVAEARKATDGAPQHGEAFAVLGLAMLAESKQNWRSAIAEAQQGVFLDPRSAKAQVAVGRIFEAADNLDQAMSAYGKALAVDAGYAPAHAGVVRIELRKGHLQQAVSDAKALAGAAPENGEAQLLLGRLLLRVNDFEAALPHLERATRLLPGSAEAQAGLGAVQQYLRRSDEALRAYGEAIKRDPANLGYRATHGLLLGITGDTDAAIAELRKVVETRGYRRPDAWVNLGWVYRNADPPRNPEAIAAYREALEIDPKSSEAALGMAWAYSHAKDWTNAIAAFQRASDASPAAAGEAAYGIGWAHYFQRDPSGAKAWAEKAQAAGRNASALIRAVRNYEAAIRKNEDERRKFEEEIEKRKLQEQAVDLAALVQAQRSPKPEVRARATRSMADAGREAVPYLTYALQDADIRVREAAADALSSMGTAARDALPALERYIRTLPSVNPFASKQELEAEAREADVRRRLKALIARLEH